MRTLPLVLLTLLSPALAAQDTGSPLVFTTLGVGTSTGASDTPSPPLFMSVSAEHSRTRGWRTLRVGGSVQGDLFTRDRYSEVHLGLGATAAAGPLLVSATAGPSVGSGLRGVFAADEAGHLRDRVRDREGAAVGLRATAQAVVVVVPEVGLGVEATHDQNTFLPVSGFRLLLSLGTHRQSLIRF